MSPTVIDKTPPRELMEAVVFRYAYDSYRERTTWEQTRSLAYFTVAPHTAKGRSTSPQKLMPMSWDKEDKSSHEGMTTEELRELYKDSPALVKKRNV